MTIIQNLPEIKVSLHPHVPVKNRVVTSTSYEVYSVLSEIWNSDTINLFEEFYALFLDRRNGVIGYRLMNRGNHCGTVVDVRLLMHIALATNSNGVILSHNHPSGKTEPSSADDALTSKINDASKLLNIKLIDHIIVTQDSYFSYADEGRII